ncbi:MAG TPA: hypothetical protein VM686_15870, partial [Polyangiaceae bacterium]|nr:hypothetical protein [Polyangiaceae bacterium]
AAPAASERAAQPVQVVIIEVTGERSAVSRTRTVASELLTRLGVASIVTSHSDDAPVPQQRAALVRAYFDLHDPTQPGIVVVEGKSEREILRRDLPESASLEVSVEELSHVLYVVVEALLREKPAEPAAQVAPVPPAPPAPKPLEKPQRKRDTPQARAGADIEAGAFFRVLELGSSRLVPGGGVALVARSSQGTVRPGAMLMGAAHGSTPLSYGIAAAGVRPFSVRLYPTLNMAAGSNVSVVTGLGGGIDWFRVERELTPAEALPGVTSVLDMTVGSFLGVRFELSDGLALDAALSLDLDLTPHSFVVETENGRSTLLELGRLRPGATFGASYSLVDGGGSAAHGGNP